MFVYHNAPIVNVVRYSCIIALQKGKLLDVPVSKSYQREGC